MLNPFPQLLIFGFFVPTLFRLVVTLTLLYATQYLWRNRAQLATLSVPVFGTVRAWMIWLGAGILVLDAFFLFIGLETQWAAIVAAIAALKYVLLPARYESARPFSRAAALFLFVICISLLFTGAGAYALDLPL